MDGAWYRRTRPGQSRMPFLERELAGDQGGPGGVSVLEEFEQVAAMVGIELGEAEVVEHDEVELGEGGEEFGIGAVAAGDGEVVQQPRQSQVQRGEPVAAGLIGERTGEPGLGNAERSGDEDVEVLAQPAPGGKREDEGLVESAGVAEVDVLDAGVGMAQLRAAQSIGHAPVVAHGEFAVDDQAEALLYRERLAGGGLELLGQRRGYAEALELMELVDGGMGQHGEVSPWWSVEVGPATQVFVVVGHPNSGSARELCSCVGDARLRGKRRRPCWSSGRPGSRFRGIGPARGGFDNDARKGPAAGPRVAIQSLSEFLRDGLDEKKNGVITMD